MRPPFPFPAVTGPALRRALVWLLLAALPLHGNAGVLQQLLGTLHRHHAVTPAGTGWGVGPALRALIGHEAAAVADPWHARSAPRAASQDHAPVGTHGHDAFERHHHGAADASVSALGAHQGHGDAAGGHAADGAGGMPPLQPSAAPGLPVPAADARAWPRRDAAVWRDHHGPPPEHPPRA